MTSKFRARPDIAAAIDLSSLFDRSITPDNFAEFYARLKAEAFSEQLTVAAMGIVLHSDTRLFAHDTFIQFSREYRRVFGFPLSEVDQL